MPNPKVVNVMERKKKIVLITISTVGIVILAIYIPYFLQNYYDPGNSDNPVFSLPIKPANYINVTHVQRFNLPGHSGFDFKLENATEIIAPISGKITKIDKGRMSNSEWAMGVYLRINPAWGMFIAFEPHTEEEPIADAQMANISAYIIVGQVVIENQTLGWLQPVPGSVYPHIHWGVYKVANWGLLGNSGSEDVNPYRYCAPWAQSILTGYCTSIGDSNPCG